MHAKKTVTVAISHCAGESCSVLVWDSCAVVIN